MKNRIMTKQERVPFAVEIQVKDINKSIKFYRDVLGFKVIRQKDDDHNKFAALTFNKSIYMIAEVPKLPEPRGVGVQLRFILPGNLKKYHDKIVSCGAKIHEPIQKKYYGITTFKIKDPDGFELKF